MIEISDINDLVEYDKEEDILELDWDTVDYTVLLQLSRISLNGLLDLGFRLSYTTHRKIFEELDKRLQNEQATRLSFTQAARWMMGGKE